MPSGGTPRRECREHEREWGGRCVDRNLTDAWLERLNTLHSLSLMGICEGHADASSGSSGRFPHINLRLKEELLPGIARRWEELRVAVLDEVSRLFQHGDTHVNLELKFRLRLGLSRLVYQQDLTMRIRASQPRTSQEMTPDARDWFERTVSCIERLDGIVLTWHHDNRED